VGAATSPPTRQRAETERNGAIVARVENSILQPTSFSAVK
jgi:hypothetical protein